MLTTDERESVFGLLALGRQANYLHQSELFEHSVECCLNYYNLYHTKKH